MGHPSEKQQNYNPVQNSSASYKTTNFPEAEESNFFLVNKKYISPKDLDKYRGQLVAISKYDEDKQIAMYGENDTIFGFPRYFFENKKNIVSHPIKDSTTLGKAISIKSHINLWDYQQKAINEFNQHRAAGRTGFFLGAAPGAGKTQMGIKMMEILGRTTLIIVPKKDLIDQWMERILATTDIVKTDIGLCESGKIAFKDKKVVIGVVHSIVKYKTLREFQDYFGTIIFDECDSSVPPATFAPCASKIGRASCRERV